MQDGKLIVYARKDQNFFIFNFTIFDKIMQVNKIANVITIIN